MNYAGTLIIWAEIDGQATRTRGGLNLVPSAYEGRIYQQNGKLLHKIPSPPHCNHGSHAKMVAIQMAGQCYAFPCANCEIIWLFKPGGFIGDSTMTGTWDVAWEAKRGRKDKHSPMDICSGQPGQIIAIMSKGWGSKWVTIFDITQIPFQVVIPKLELGIQPGHICYCNLPGVGETLAMSSTFPTQYKLAMYSLASGKCLWTVGGQDKTAEPVHKEYGDVPEYPSVKVDGACWNPQGVCTDNRGRLYVADDEKANPRILVFSAASGDIIQSLSGPEWLGRPEHLSWCEAYQAHGIAMTTTTLAIHHWKGNDYPYKQLINPYKVEV